MGRESWSRKEEVPSSRRVEGGAADGDDDAAAAAVHPNNHFHLLLHREVGALRGPMHLDRVHRKRGTRPGVEPGTAWRKMGEREERVEREEWVARERVNVGLAPATCREICH